jgi:hypothetical protein
MIHCFVNDLLSNGAGAKNSYAVCGFVFIEEIFFHEIGDKNGVYAWEIEYVDGIFFSGGQITASQAYSFTDNKEGEIGLMLAPNLHHCVGEVDGAEDDDVWVCGMD